MAVDINKLQLNVHVEGDDSVDDSAADVDSLSCVMNDRWDELIRECVNEVMARLAAEKER